MSMIEPLEARIAPAVVITNPLPDLKPGGGTRSATLDLAQLTAAASSSAYHTKVKFITNFDTDLTTAGIQAGEIVIELYDDLAPLTVQNFLAYVNNANARGDYDDTLFHRAVPGFILQSGGFEATTPNVHIPVGATVHNEADVATRSNLEGTIAMAKVASNQGGGPNSATSEWFVNLANNSTNLDVQNGGFTVFGKVDAAGLQIAKDITALATITDIQPKQGGVAIKVVSAEVIAPTSPATTLTYTVESVAPLGPTPAGLVTTKINGSKLTVTYAGNKSGIVDVTVKASDGTTFATDTFRVEVRPNFIVNLAGGFSAGGLQVAGDALPGLLVPSDGGSISVNVSNTGGSSGGGKVQFFLSQVTVTQDTDGSILYSDVTPASTIPLSGSGNFTVASGKTQTVTVPVKLPSGAFVSPDTFYRVVARVVPNDTALSIEELFSDANGVTDDNTSGALSLHQPVNKFGTISDVNFATRTVVLKYTTVGTDNKTATSTWAMKGPGAGTVTFDAQGKETTLSLQGTTFASSITPVLSKNHGRLALASIDIPTAIGTANFGLADLSGPLTASGGIRSLTLGNVSGQSLFSIGAGITDGRVKAALSFGSVQNLSIESNQPLASLTVASWVDTDANNDSIVAPSLGKLVVKGTGNFEADLTLNDNTVPLTSISIGGFLRNAAITAAGDVGAVKVGGVNKGSIFAGVAARPTTFANTEAHKIASFTVAGIAGVTAPLFVDSQIAAQTIGTIKVKGVRDVPSATASGFVAEVVRSYSRPGVVTKTNLTTDYDDAVDGANVGYLVKILQAPV